MKEFKEMSAFQQRVVGAIYAAIFGWIFLSMPKFIGDLSILLQGRW